ncbi:hypothetical protein Aperf_G00000124029 [Anoplocephala perfoliata]
MGVDGSKLAGPQRYFDQFSLPYFRVTGRPWTLVQSCSLDAWRKKYCDLYNFADSTMECPYNKPTECTNSFCLIKQNIVNLSKRKGTFSFHKRSKYSKLAEHFEYNHIPAHLSSVQNLHFKSILCTRNGLAIVHLARNLIAQFGIVDLHIHKFLGTFGRQSIKYSPDSVAAEISPDSSLCLVRLPWSRTNRVTTLQLYSLRTRELITELPLTTDTIHLNPASSPIVSPSSGFPGFEDDTESIRTDYGAPTTGTSADEPVRAFGGYNQPNAILFDFDPRFENSRVLLANVHFVQPQQQRASPLYQRRFSLGEGFFESQAPCLSLVRLPTWQKIAQTKNFGGLPDSLLQEQRTDRRQANGISILKVFYSRAGHLIFAIVTTVSNCKCNSSAIFFNEGTFSCNNSPDLSRQRQWFVRESSIADNNNQQLPPLPGFTPLYLIAFHGDTLDTLQVIRFDRRLCPLHACPTNYVPVMSRCGARLALVALAIVGGGKRAYRGGKRGVNDADFVSGTPRRRKVNTIHISSSAAIDAGLSQGRPGSSHISTSWIESEMEMNAWAEDDMHALSKSALYETGNYSPCCRKLQEIVFIYQLEPPPSLQAIAREKIRQYFSDETLDQLGLPPGLLAYLRFQPSFSCSGSCLSGSDSISTMSALLTPQCSNSFEL